MVADGPSATFVVGRRDLDQYWSKPEKYNMEGMEVILKSRSLGIIQKAVAVSQENHERHQKEYAKWESKEKAILGLSNQTSPAPSQVEPESESEWVSYTGPRGGKGWENKKTGKIVRGRVRPDERRRPSDGRAT